MALFSSWGGLSHPPCSTGILLSAGSKMRAVNLLRSKKILRGMEKSTRKFAQLCNQEVPTREELQASLQVNIGPNYTKGEIIIGEYLQTEL